MDLRLKFWTVAILAMVNAAVADVVPLLYDTATKRIVAPTNLAAFSLGGREFTNLLGFGLAVSNQQLSVDTTQLPSGGGSGTVTSVGASTTVSGLGFSGSPVTASGTLSLTGVVAVASGGTGATDASGARSVLSLVPGTLGTVVIGE